MTTSSAAPTHLVRTHAIQATWLRRVLIALSATLVVAAAAHVAFPLPFTPVPFTLQPLAVLGVGLLLGPVDGALAMLVYLCEGAAGLPVFSPTGPGGLAQLLGPTGGFLLAYPFVALITGAVAKTMRSRFSPFSAAAVSCSLATAFLFLVGALWLGREAHLSAHVLWMAAVAPFLPGEVIKILAVSGTYRALARPSSR